MRRPDPLTYDTTQRRRLDVSWRLIALLTGVAAVAALLVIWTLQSSAQPDKPARPVPTHVAPRSPSPTASPTPTGSDTIAPKGAPARSEAATDRFLQAWLERTPALRKTELEQTATPELAEMLMMTSQANIPDAHPVGGPVLVRASDDSVQFLQKLSNGVTVRIYLAADPQARYGWLATAIEQA